MKKIIDKAILSLNLKQLDIAAICFAVLLSFSCLARGAVYDATIAFLLLPLMPILFFAARKNRTLHPVLRKIGILFFCSIMVILFLQQWLSPQENKALWHDTQLITNITYHAGSIYDQAAWLQGFGRFLFLLFVFLIALYIGSCESSARLFLQALLISGTFCAALTFFSTTAEGMPSSSFHTYRHGFVNVNNAASYLGIMFLVSLMQTNRFLRHSGKIIHKKLPDIIDGLNLPWVIQGFFLLFSLLLFSAGLFMTGSRGGIFISLLCCFIFFILTVLRGNLHSQTRKFIIICSAIFMGSILTWIFLNFGQMFVSILEREGFSHHTRLEIYSAVIPMIRDHAWLGVGLDNFAGVFQQYRPKDVSADGIIDKAHNSYLEFAAELGLPGLLILLCSVVAIGMILVNGVVGRKERYVTPALGLSIWLLAALHSLIDFPLQIPGIAAIVIAVVTICASQADPRFSEPATSSSKTAPVRRIRIRKQRSFSKSG